MTTQDKAKFAVGDLVELKSGSPRMTVTEVHEQDARGSWSYRCAWFAGKKKESSSFPHEALEVSKSDDG